MEMPFYFCIGLTCHTVLLRSIVRIIMGQEKNEKHIIEIEKTSYKN